MQKRISCSRGRTGDPFLFILNRDMTFLKRDLTLLKRDFSFLKRDFSVVDVFCNV